MQPAGREAYEARTENRSGVYSYEQRTVRLAEPYAGHFRRNKKKLANWWVLSAKKEETRLKRLTKLIEISAQGGRVI